MILLSQTILYNFTFFYKLINVRRSLDYKTDETWKHQWPSLCRIQLFRMRQGLWHERFCKQARLRQRQRPKRQPDRLFGLLH